MKVQHCCCQNERSDIYFRKSHAKFQWTNILLLWLTCFCSFHSFAQNTFLSGNLLVEHFALEEGLPENLVTNVLQDRKGFLWMTSAFSLMRYDGYSFKTWRLDEANTRFSASTLFRQCWKTGREIYGSEGGKPSSCLTPKQSDFPMWTSIPNNLGF
ncbi:MAG: hypothetical protein IPM82_16120 [Saprospiraceae bacterium]|nr:hypothetical protein [Saprospiraceae bacterium]